MISKISNDDFSNENFKFGYAKFIKIKDIEVWAQRLSYVGELGYELYVKSSESKKLYDIIFSEGKNFKWSIVECMLWILCEWRVVFYIGATIFLLRKTNIKQV